MYSTNIVILLLLFLHYNSTGVNKAFIQKQSCVPDIRQNYQQQSNCQSISQSGGVSTTKVSCNAFPPLSVSCLGCTFNKLLFIHLLTLFSHLKFCLQLAHLPSMCSLRYCVIIRKHVTCRIKKHITCLVCTTFNSSLLISSFFKTSVCVSL